MNWNLILRLSVFGLVMGLATVFVIPSNVEPIFWLVIFLICAYVIAKTCPDKPFVHGLLLGIANSIWITAAHVLLFSSYVANHAQEMEMMKSMPVPKHPRMMMAMTGPVIGVVSGAIIGIFAIIAAKIMKPSSKG